MSIDPREFSQLFADLDAKWSQHEVDTLAAVLHERHAVAGEVLIREGVVPGTLYFVAAGRCEVSFTLGDAPVAAGTIGPGTLFGEISFVDGGPGSATVTALDPCRLFCLSTLDFEALRQRDIRLATDLLRLLCHLLSARVRLATERLAVEREGLPGETAPEPGGVAGAHRARLTDSIRSLLGIIHTRN